MQKKIHFIINPAAGQPYPILRTINEVCEKHQCAWSVSVTQKDNFSQIAKEAASSDAQIIAIYGGDGTIVQFAETLIKTKKTLGILPGGTANVLSVELGIPQDIEKACELICSSKGSTKQIDAAQFGNNYFLLRLGFGFEAEAVKETDRADKGVFGWLAYALSGFKALLKTKATSYEIIIDGQKHECEGLSLVIANSGNIGIKGVSLFPKINISDGLLDVLVIRLADIKKLFSSKAGKGSKKELLQLFQHWQAKKVSVKASPKQTLHYDGETVDQDKIKVVVLPKAVRVITSL